MTRTHATRARGVEAAVVAAIAILATAAAWLRLPPIAQRTVWAEDGTIFVNDAISGRPLEHLFAGYMGYLQFVPRLLADAAVSFARIQDVALFINLSACAVAGLCAALVFWCAQDVVPARALRFVLAAITIGAPLLPIEVLGNAANVHWIFIWTMLWVLLYLPRTRVGAWLLGLVALICALSDIQLLFLVPLFFVRRRSALVWPPRIGLVVGLIAQIATSLLSPREAHSGGLGGAIRAYIGQTALASYLPDPKLLDAALGNLRVLWLALAIAPFVVAFVYVLKRGSGLQRITVLYLVPGSAVLWTADSYLNGYGGAALTPHAFSFVRYAVVPSMMLLASVIVAAQILLTRSSRPCRVVGAVAAVAVVALLAIHFVPYDTNRSNGPTWDTAIERAQMACNSEPGSAEEPITTAPKYGTVRWVVSVPCSRID
ncbi:hypothetical protein [Lacisediminihabitans changchengi]|uniref:Uncharacterized protein n=1 Tax=Lacisediminihabitans changchengi TaxID=2787634 RepID=A0A934SNZ8_9MICO|nr:hypothetical protein [Lacisediminihabitans changchengi]MBK4346433.1 hypothetical protein [Lacisediminihabitans changchengi]